MSKERERDGLKKKFENITCDFLEENFHKAVTYMWMMGNSPIDGVRYTGCR